MSRARQAIATGILAIAAALAFLGCGGSEAPSPLGETALKNAAYPAEVTGMPGEPVQLVDGSFSAPIAGGASRTTVTFIRYAAGQLNEGKTEDAAVLLAFSGGGSGTFVNLVAVLNEDGEPRPVATLLLGDRVVIDDLAVVDGQMVLQMRTHAETDPFCCPSLQVTRTYALEDGDIRLLSETPR